MSMPVNTVGFLSGIAAGLAVVAYDVAQLAQLAGWLVFPFDEVLIYAASLCIVIPFMLEMLALHRLTPPRLRFWTHGALLFTTIYAVFAGANYVVQLATVVPAKLRGELGGVALLEQTPHSLFWNFDALAYVCMGAACLLAAQALGQRGFEHRVQVALLAHAAVTPLIGVVYFHPDYSPRLLLVGVPWAVTAPVAMFLLAWLLRKRSLVA